MTLADSELSPPEQELREAMNTGTWVDLRKHEPTADDPSQGAKWGTERTIRAAVLADLLTKASGPQRPRALRLAGARVIGELDLEAAELVCPVMLFACSFAEPVNVGEATVPSLRLPGCYLPGLKAWQLTTQGNLGLNFHFTARELILVGAHIGGQLDLSGAILNNPSGTALHADGATVGQNLLCRGIAAEGTVNLRAARIGGQLILTNATLNNPNGVALHCNRLAVERDMHCNGDFKAYGEVHLLGARIGGQLDLTGTLNNPNKIALNGNQLTVEQGIHCRDDFTVYGEIHLVNAHIGGEFDLTGTLLNPGGIALRGDGLAVEQNMFCHGGLSISGAVVLSSVHIPGHLAFVRAILKNPNGVALDLQNARIGTLLLHLDAPPRAINLTHAQLGVLEDDPATWPDQLQLRGCTYDSLHERSPVNSGQRMDWLRRDPDGYAPQPYDQLAAVYRRGGREEDARQVAIRKQRERRRTLPMPSKAGSLLLDVLVNYGYRPWLAGLWLLGLMRAGQWIFDLAYPSRLIATKPAGERPAFHSGLYALDLLLPIGDLNYQGAWIAQGWARWCWLAWIMAGWVLTIAFLAALSGILKRD
jgi:hypothetical protein